MRCRCVCLRQMFDLCFLRHLPIRRFNCAVLLVAVFFDSLTIGRFLGKSTLLLYSRRNVVDVDSIWRGAFLTGLVEEVYEFLLVTFSS